MHFHHTARTVGDWNQLPAVVVEQESPAAFKNQLYRLAHVVINAPPPAIGVIHEEVCRLGLLVKTRQERPDKLQRCMLIPKKTLMT